MPLSELCLSLKAYAKINLALDVIGKRPDGFHEVVMIMQSISLHDLVFMSLRKNGITLSCNNAELPCDKTNLVFRAAELVQKEVGVQKGVYIKLTKNIPLAAGLAGGSSDAAAVLKGLNTLWELALSTRELETLAARLGSDVPFCLWGGTALATGRGECLEPLPDFSGVGVVLANPPLQVSTAWVYGRFRQELVLQRPNLAGMRLAIGEKDFEAVAGQLVNVLETVTVPAHPQIADIKKLLSNEGARGVLMSGSGPTVFALTPSLDSARQLAGRISHGTDASIFVAETVAREDEKNVPSIITG